MALCDSWDSNWMDGSCGFDGASNPDDDEQDVDAFQAALQPLPAWDGVPCSDVANWNNGSGCSHEDLGAAIRRRRVRECAKNASYFWPEDQDMVINDPDLDVVGHGKDKPGGSASADSSILRASKAVADPNVTLQPPQQQPWPLQHSTSPGQQQHRHVSETEGTLTHVIRLQRTGSVVVERKGSPSGPGDNAEKARFVGLGQHGGGSGYYAEEERFWQERCPTDRATTTAARGESRADDTAQPRKASSIGARLDVRTPGEASYNYSKAEAAYRPSARASATHHPAGPHAYSNDGTVKKDGRSRRQSTRKTRFEESTGDALEAAGEIVSQELLRSPPRQAATGNRGVRADRIEKKEGDARRRRSRSLRDTESVLDGVLESMACAGPKGNTFSDEDAGIHPRRNTESSPRLSSTQQEQRASALRQRVDDVFRGEARKPTSKGKIRYQPDDVDGTSPRRSRQVHRFRRDRGDDYDDDDHNGQSPRRSRRFSLGRSRGGSDGAEFGGGGTTVGVDSQTRRGIEGARDEGEEDAEDASAGRVAELGRRIAVRCLHMEEECLRRERAQTRLFQEQLCGARQAAQDAARRIIHDDRSRSKQVLTEMQKRFEERETELVDKLEKAEESWATEREALSAAATAAKAEVDRVRRQAREAAEAGKRENEKAMEKQRFDLQRGWAEEKGGMRRSAEDALRRAVEGKTRAEEKTALEAKTVQESLSAQVRSWKAKAEVAERRALEERDKRKGLEAGAKGALAQEVEKARQEQESVLRDLRTKTEGDRVAHASEVERLEEAHRANLLRVHEEKKKLSDTARRRWQQDMQELRAEAAAKAEDAATRAAAERAEALRRLRLAHDAEMRKAGRDILRLERELRRGQQEEPKTGVTRSNADALLSPLPLGSYSPKTRLPEVEPQMIPSPVPDSVDTAADPTKNGGDMK